ncbi:MAG: trypsin-like peptidase domain-containing protein [Planctomycetes bacterium]|nr:trypsin-like peptidase domain-containing protein [Planctomycetota bacterium]
MRIFTYTMAGLLAWTVAASAQDPMVLKSEADRVAAIEKVKPTVVAVFARGGQGGGTGVLINDQGYALTNFHVVQPTGPTMQCGLSNGVLYDAVLVGWDKVGDVALIKLLPKKDGDKFPYAVMGNSDLMRAGDWWIAMGNPFLLATDFTPTVTFGLVSGVDRYQPPAGIFLEYTNCIQIDTSINPGNSGGPLFNLKGEIIGINGRGSFDKRGRINSGVGYAISINQIKNFMGHLHAGIDADHASLGALVRTEAEKNGLGRTKVTAILEDADAARRGLDQDDELMAFAGRSVTSDNHYKNVIGLFPRGWRLPLEFRRGDTRKEILVRLMGVQRKELPDPTAPKDDPKQPGPKKGKGAQGPAAKFYEPKAGYANYYFNRQEKIRAFADFKKHSDFSTLAGEWKVEGTVRLLKLRNPSPFTLEIGEHEVGKSVVTKAAVTVGAFTDRLDPLDKDNGLTDMRKPNGSGGLVAALYVWRHLLTEGEKGFPTECNHGGSEPIYPPPPNGVVPNGWMKRHVVANVVTTRLANYQCKWFFAQNDHKLLGFELRLQDANEDPCEVYFSDYRNVNGRQLPHEMQVYYRDVHYGTFTFTKYQLAPAPGK